MPLPVWIALALSLVVVVASGAFALSRGLGTWRTQRRFRRHVLDGLGQVTRGVAGIEQRLSAAGRTATELQRAQAELQDSLAAARVLSAAFAEVRATLSRFTGVVPSK